MLRLSVSTRIFLGFAVVIIAFGATCAFTLYEMSSQRRAATLLWREVIPMHDQLDGLMRQLKTVEGMVRRFNVTDQPLLRRMMPKTRPFVGPTSIEAIVARLDNVADTPLLHEDERAAFVEVRRQLVEFAESRVLADAVAGVAPKDLVSLADPLPSADLYDQLLRRANKLLTEDSLTAESQEARALAMVLRRIQVTLQPVAQTIAQQITAVDGRAEARERSTTLAVVIVATGALLLSLLMLFISLWTLRPISRLTAGAKRIGAGHYDERVDIGGAAAGRDEIQQLGAEFNRMAASLQSRDAELAASRDELLRTERLATIGKLSAQITHEVRNPLSSISLNAEFIEEELTELSDAPVEVRDSLKAIMSEVQRLRSITDGYLHFARLPKPNRVQVDVGALLSDFAEFIKREVHDAGIELELSGVASSLEGGPPPVRADADQLRQAIINVARNGIEALATVPKPRHLAIRLAPSPEGVTIEVVDNGPGIPDEVRERLFDPFVTGKSYGTGLGLALTREIVLEHGGSIDAVSPVQSGKGTSFTIRLPREPQRRNDGGRA